MINYLKDKIEIYKANQNIRKVDRHYSPILASAEKAKRDRQECEDIAAEWYYTTREYKDQIERVLSRMLIRKAERLNVPTPDYDCEDMWVGKEREYLNGKGRRVVGKAIRMEIKERLEVWIPLVTAVTGLLGVVIGLIAIFKK